MHVVSQKIVKYHGDMTRYLILQIAVRMWGSSIFPSVMTMVSDFSIFDLKFFQANMTDFRFGVSLYLFGSQRFHWFLWECNLLASDTMCLQNSSMQSFPLYILIRLSTSPYANSDLTHQPNGLGTLTIPLFLFL